MDYLILAPEHSSVLNPGDNSCFRNRCQPIGWISKNRSQRFDRGNQYETKPRTKPSIGNDRIEVEIDTFHIWENSPIPDLLITFVSARSEFSWMISEIVLGALQKASGSFIKSQNYLILSASFCGSLTYGNTEPCEIQTIECPERLVAEMDNIIFLSKVSNNGAFSAFFLCLNKILEICILPYPRPPTTGRREIDWFQGLLSNVIIFTFSRSTPWFNFLPITHLTRERLANPQRPFWNHFENYLIRSSLSRFSAHNQGHVCLFSVYPADAFRCLVHWFCLRANISAFHRKNGRIFHITSRLESAFHDRLLRIFSRRSGNHWFRLRHNQEAKLRNARSHSELLSRRNGSWTWQFSPVGHGTGLHPSASSLKRVGGEHQITWFERRTQSPVEKITVANLFSGTWEIHGQYRCRLQSQAMFDGYEMRFAFSLSLHD